MPQARKPSKSRPTEEWAYLALDLDDNCPTCGLALRAGQAVGNVEGTTVHAKCYEEWKRVRNRPT